MFLPIRFIILFLGSISTPFYEILQIYGSNNNEP
jgi:hypothetical protein